jgi:hypothetical protein
VGKERTRGTDVAKIGKRDLGAGNKGKAKGGRVIRRERPTGREGKVALWFKRWHDCSGGRRIPFLPNVLKGDNWLTYQRKAA